MPDPGIYKQVRWSRSDLIPSYNVYLDSDGVERRSKTWISTNEVWSEPPIAVKTDTKVSFKTPDYRTRRRNRLPLPDNYFHRSGVTVASGVMSASYLNPTTGAQSSWRCSVSPFITVGTLPIGDTVPVCQRAESAAIFDVQSKSRGHQWNAPVFIAEAGKTAEMVYNRAHHLTTLARHLLRGNFVGFARNLASELPSRKYSRGIRRFNREYQKDPTKAAANAWLEYTYGWTPFMSDVRNAANVLFDVVHNEPMRVYVSVGRGNSREVIDHVNNNTTFLGYGVRTSWRETREVSSKVVWRYQIAPWSLPNQIGLDNPALVAWELVPFSFVADWFLPIGDYISQLSLNPAVPT